MSNITAHVSGISTPFCIRSLARASERSALSPKDEILISLRLLSAAYVYHSSFSNFVRDHADDDFKKGVKFALACKSSGLIKRKEFSEAERSDFRKRTEFYYDQLDGYLTSYLDQGGEPHQGLANVLAAGPAFINAQKIAESGSFESGTHIARFINPYVVINVAKLVNFDICRDIVYAQEDKGHNDLVRRLAMLYAEVGKTQHNYPLTLTPHTAPPYLNDNALKSLIFEREKVKEFIDNFVGLDPTTMRASLVSFESVNNYLSPFRPENFEEPSEDFSNGGSSVLSVSDWGPLALAARTRREERRKEHPELLFPR